MYVCSLATTQSLVCFITEAGDTSKRAVSLHSMYTTCQVFDDVVWGKSSVGGDRGGGGMGALCEKQTTHKRG